MIWGQLGTFQRFLGEESVQPFFDRLPQRVLLDNREVDFSCEITEHRRVVIQQIFDKARDALLFPIEEELTLDRVRKLVNAAQDDCLITCFARIAQKLPQELQRQLVLPADRTAQGMQIRRWLLEYARAFQAIEELDLSDLNLSFLPPEIFNFTGLKKLVLAGNRIHDLKGLQRLTKLVELDLSNNGLLSLEKLYLTATSLRHLNLSSNYLCEVDGRTLPETLESLNLGNCSLTTFRGFSGQSLHYLDLSRNQMVLLEAIPSVKVLSLMNNAITQIGGLCLSKWVGLMHLKLGGNALDSLMAADLPQSLEILDLTGCSLESLNRISIAAMPNLEALILAKNSIREIRNDQLPPKLVALNLENNNIETLDLIKISNLQNLKNLFLSGNRIQRLESKQLPPNINHLSLARNELRNFGFDLSSCLTMQTLDLTHNKLEDMGGVFPTNLQELFLSDNAISNLEKIRFSNLYKLKALHLGGNQIVEVPRGILPDELEKLYLDENQIEEQRKVHLPRSLKLLDLRRNKIKQFDGSRVSRTVKYVDLREMAGGVQVVNIEQNLQVLTLETQEFEDEDEDEESLESGSS